MKLNLTKIGTMTLAAALTVGAVSCNRKGCTDPEATNYSEKAKKDDGSCEYDEVVTGEAKSGMISADETWTNDKMYTLNGKVVVESGVTLTIEPGTIIKGAEGLEANASALIVARGGKIMAQGTAEAPIIFTTVLDNIQIGQTSGTNLTENDNGKWGGLLVLGNAPISAADGDVVSQIEGIPASEAYGAYGGSDVADNSGVIKYVSIRHGGALIGDGNEINGLTLGGVGNGTVIDHVEVLANQDDGIECFGGSVNISNAIVGYCGDDAIDLDQNYSGTIDNFVVVTSDISDEGLEIDGVEGSTYTDGMFTLNNGSVYSKGGEGTPGDFKDKAQGTVNNVKFFDFTDGDIKIRTKYTDNCQTTETDALTNLIDPTAKLVFTASEFGGVKVYTKSEDDSQATCPIKSTEQTEAEARMTSTAATGASTGVFTWSWMSEMGKM